MVTATTPSLACFSSLLHASTATTTNMEYSLDTRFLLLRSLILSSLFYSPNPLPPTHRERLKLSEKFPRREKVPDEEVKRFVGSGGDFIDFPINSGHPKSLTPPLQHTTFSRLSSPPVASMWVYGRKNSRAFTCWWKPLPALGTTANNVFGFTTKLSCVLHPITITVTIKRRWIHQKSRKNNIDGSATFVNSKSPEKGVEKVDGLKRT